MNKFLFAVAALPFISGVALAADWLSDSQMAQITAGAFDITAALPSITCPSCLTASSNSTSTNGATQTTNSTGTTGGGTPGGGATPGGGGTPGGGSPGGGGTPGSGTTGGTSQASTPIVLPSTFLTIISSAAGFTPMLH